MALIKCGGKKWRKVINTIHINTTTGSNTYTFQHPIRNPKIYCNINGSWRRTSGRNYTSFFIGFGGDYQRQGYWWYDSMDYSSGEKTYSKNGWGQTGQPIPYQVSDNVKHKTLTLAPYVIAEADNCTFTTTTKSSDIWITEYEEYK